MSMNNAVLIQPNPIIPDISINSINDISSLIHLSNFEFKSNYGKGKEAHMIRNEIGDFDLMKSDAMKLLRQYYGYSLRITELKGLINAVRDYMGRKGVNMPKLSRNANRSFQLCVKYIQDNIEVMQKIIPFVKLGDSQCNAIPLSEY
ncbi:hypothetical protein M9Y10_013340 [Tritrichomonas musculus]|uniref:Uncharacterized protein n=1 Tax=Tritrichomonas musculus TaxID=1915356 RepID=A0ABR2I6U7_9EUKA